MAVAGGHQRHMPPPPLHSAWSGGSTLPSRAMPRLIIIARMYRIWCLKLPKINNIIVHCPSGYKIAILNGEMVWSLVMQVPPPTPSVFLHQWFVCIYTNHAHNRFTVYFFYVLVHAFANNLLGKLHTLDIIFQITPWPRVSPTGGPSTNPSPCVISSSSQLIIVIPHYRTCS